MTENKKVLIIEDDKFLAKMLARMLESKNIQVSMATTGQEGFTKTIDVRPDLVLLDIMLPDIDGFEILKKIKANDALKNIPVMVMSNLGQPEDINQAKNLGAVDHLVKSDLGLDEVVDKVSSQLNL